MIFIILIIIINIIICSLLYSINILYNSSVRLNKKFSYFFQSIRNNLKETDRLMKMNFSQQRKNENLEAPLS